MSYGPSERRWVMALVARLSPEQRHRYEEECRQAPRHPSTGKLYDDEKARIAERILYEDAVKRDSR